MFDPQRLAAALYAWDGLTAERYESPYGMFVHNTVRDELPHSTGLQSARCLNEQFPDFLVALEANYKRFDKSHRWLSGYDPRSLAFLSQGLLPLGYSSQVYWAMVKTTASSRAVNPDLEVRITEPAQQEGYATVQLEAAQLEGTDEREISYAREMLRQLGGREAVVYQGGQAIAAGGYYRVDGITCLTSFVTGAASRGQGAATALVAAILAQPEVASSEATVLCALEGESLKLYESLGFTRNHFFFVFSKPDL